MQGLPVSQHCQPSAELLLSARDAIGLVEQVEDHRVVALEGVRHRRPERDRLRRVRHRLLAGGLRGRAAGRRSGVDAVGPVQVEDRDDAVGVQQADVALDRVDVVGARVGGVDIRLGVPARLVQRHAHRVDRPPALHRGDGRLVIRAVEDAVALDARVLGARTVDAVQHDLVAVGVDQLVARYVQLRRGARRRRHLGHRERRPRCSRSALAVKVAAPVLVASAVTVTGCAVA